MTIVIDFIRFKHKKNMTKCRKLATDAIIIKNNRIVLIKRKYNPYKNYYAFPGGHLNINETFEEACVREVREETSLKVRIRRLVNVYSSPKRYPGCNTISACYECAALSGYLKGGDDAAEAHWVSLSKLPKKMAFDHAQMIKDYIKIAQNNN